MWKVHVELEQVSTGVYFYFYMGGSVSPGVFTLSVLSVGDYLFSFSGTRHLLGLGGDLML